MACGASRPRSFLQGAHNTHTRHNTTDRTSHTADHTLHHTPHTTQRTPHTSPHSTHHGPHHTPHTTPHVPHIWPTFAKQCPMTAGRLSKIDANDVPGHHFGDLGKTNHIFCWWFSGDMLLERFLEPFWSAPESLGNPSPRNLSLILNRLWFPGLVPSDWIRKSVLSIVFMRPELRFGILRTPNPFLEVLWPSLWADAFSNQTDTFFI